MTLTRERAVAAFRDAIAACDPGRRVADALAGLAPRLVGKRCLGIAVGKSALAMARGARVDHGLAVTVAAGPVPAGWSLLVAAHPEPDATSLEAGRAVRALVESATADEVVLALISGGASALIEEPRIPLADFVAIIRALMAEGAPIAVLNLVRRALSGIKAGQLVARCAAPVITLVASDIVGDPIELVGSAPTIARQTTSLETQRRIAVSLLGDFDLAVPAVLREPRDEVAALPAVRAHDHAELVLPMRAFAEAVARATAARLVEAPLVGLVDEVARRVAAEPGPGVLFGEPTLDIPADHGEGGRAQQLALELARRFRGTGRAAFVAGTDGSDGPAPRRRATPAGAFVDGTTWDAILAAGIDPDRALARRDAGTALAAAGALVVTGPTGVNHADVVMIA